MQITVERIPISEMTLSRFRSEFYTTGRERPVVLTGIPIPDPDALTFDEFCEKYLRGAVKSRAWYDAPLPAESDPEMPFPELVRQVLRAPDASIRDLPMRLWAHPGGHETLFHYDANSLHSFNLQLKGRKRWTIVSSDTPLPSHPFQFVTAVPKSFVPSPAKYDVATFEMQAGDMLYMPRYWQHGVVSCGEVNLSANWVWTSRAPNDTALGRREREFLAMRRAWPIVESLFLGDLVGYGGDDSIVDTYTSGVRRRKMVQRFVEELGGTPRLLFSLPSTLRQLKTFASNNFNVPSERTGRAPS
jgi:hypothetical protein